MPLEIFIWEKMFSLFLQDSVKEKHSLRQMKIQTDLSNPKPRRPRISMGKKKKSTRTRVTRKNLEMILEKKSRPHASSSSAFVCDIKFASFLPFYIYFSSLCTRAASRECGGSFSTLLSPLRQCQLGNGDFRDRDLQ